MLPSILVFDIETVPDVALAKHFYDLDLSDEDTLSAMQKIRRQEIGSDFPRIPFHEVACISGLWVNEKSGQFQLFSWTQQQHSEAEILQRFVHIFDKHEPILVSWNGSQFDIPVVMQRCMYHGITAPSLFEQGERDKQKRYNNYQNRYHQQHTDLMDVLASFNSKHFQKLDDMAKVLGFPGKLGMTGNDVNSLFFQQKWQEISRYCESDVLNTWLIYLRWLLLRGFIFHEHYQGWIKQTIDYLRQQPQHEPFLQAWQKSAQTTAFSKLDLVNFDSGN